MASLEPFDAGDVRPPCPRKRALLDAFVEAWRAMAIGRELPVGSDCPACPLCFRRVDSQGPDMQLASDGCCLVPELLNETECDHVARRLNASASTGAGSRRLLDEDWCADLARQVMSHPDVRRALPRQARAIQCTFFEKSASTNWLVPIHQDLSVPVAGRVDHPALSGWSEKEGALFVQAPGDVLAQLLAVRVHIDRCSDEDGPLRVVPGSHELGRVDPGRAAMLGRTRGVTVPANRGDALLMRPLLLHASSKSSGTSLRRVLHFLFGPEALPYGLAW